MDVEVKYDRYGKLVANCSATSKNSENGKEAEVLFINTYEEPEPDSTEESTTTEEPTTTQEQTTTTELTPTEEPTTATEVTPTKEPSTTAELVPSEEPDTTTELTSEEPTTTEEPTTEATTTPTGKSGKPKTGDDTNIPILIALLCTAVLGMTGCIRYRYLARKHDKEHEQ
jgi:cytoskeletal protein RodZ